MIDQLITEYSPLLTKLCLQLCRNVQDANDLYQDTWMRVIQYSKRHSLEKIEYPKAWLCKICIRLFCDRAERLKRENREEFESAEAKDFFLQSIPDPNDRAAYTELYDALSSLTPKQKSAVILKYFYGFSDKELAAMLRLPLGTLRSRLYDALKKLRRILDEETTEL